MPSDWSKDKPWSCMLRLAAEDDMYWFAQAGQPTSESCQGLAVERPEVIALHATNSTSRKVQKELGNSACIDGMRNPDRSGALGRWFRKLGANIANEFLSFVSS
eukprot:6013019-Amphidinium_carterae.1